MLHIVWCYVFVHAWGWGVVGVGVAMSLSYAINFALITVICRGSRSLQSSFFWFTQDTFVDLKEYLKIGIPSALMLGFEWGGFEVLIVVAGFINVTATGAQVIAINTFFVLMMIPLGL